MRVFLFLWFSVHRPKETKTSKKRKVFQKVEIASMDAVFKASNGLPSASMTERLAESMDLTTIQVIKIIV